MEAYAVTLPEFATDKQACKFWKGTTDTDKLNTLVTVPPRLTTFKVKDLQLDNKHKEAEQHQAAKVAEKKQKVLLFSRKARPDHKWAEIQKQRSKNDV